MPDSNRPQTNTTLPYSYPPIPLSARDDSDVVGERDVGHDYGVKSWGNPETAAQRATLEERVTDENESLFRTYHPALSSERYVFMRKEPNGKRSWVIWKTANTKITPTHIGDREVHVIPRFKSPLLAGYCVYKLAMVFIRRGINPRRALRPEDLDKIRQGLPTAIGVRILIAGVAIVFFRSTEDMIDAWDAGIPDSIGGLQVGFCVSEFKPSAEPVSSGNAVSNNERGLRSLAALGLKLKMPDKIECITTVSHAFVGLPNRWSTIQMRLADWAARIRRVLTRLLRPAAQVYEHAGEEKPEAIGKEVWLAGTSRKIGTIEKTYDNPDRKHPYPAKFPHDLSLISGTNLPEISAPPGINMLNQWAPYEDALDGKPVFATSLNAQCQSTRCETPAKDYTTSKAVQTAVVEGCDYMWDEESRVTNASLLWRTSEEPQECSGNVLCLGRPDDAEARPILFQNYQSPIHKWPLGEKSSRRKPTDSFKGGFFLPEDVRQAEILLGKTKE